MVVLGAALAEVFVLLEIVVVTMALLARNVNMALPKFLLKSFMDLSQQELKNGFLKVTSDNTNP